MILPDKYPLPDGHPLSIRTPRPASSAFGAATEASVVKDTIKTPTVATDAQALLRIIDSATVLHARPMEFFLGNSTERDHIGIGVTFDANVYTKADAEEFIDECRRAALFYLGVDLASRSKL